MKLPRPISRLLQDPPPALAFELSEAGIAAARTAAGDVAFQPLKPGSIAVSPLQDNVLLPDEVANAIKAVAPSNGARKKREAALILPDYATRISVLDFDDFPSDHKEQRSLVMFRMKKALPYDVESAALSYFPQHSGGKRHDVIAVAAPLEIVSRYEAPLRAVGWNPGTVTTSCLAALELIQDPAALVAAKLTGRVLTVMVLVNRVVKLVRCLEIAEPTVEEIAAVLVPTFVYMEDSLGTRPEKLVLCGFGAIMEAARQYFHRESGLDAEPLRSPWGIAGEHNAGLLGFLQSVRQS